MATIHVTGKFLDNVFYGNIYNSYLRDDIENANIYDTKLIPQGYIGNRPNDFKGDFHEDDTWAIDCFTNDGIEVTTYLYSSEFEYDNDVSMITDFKS